MYHPQDNFFESSGMELSEANKDLNAVNAYACTYTYPSTYTYACTET